MESIIFSKGYLLSNFVIHCPYLFCLIYYNRSKYYRFRKRYTRKQLAEKINVSVNYLGRIERGKHSVDFDVIEALSSALDIRTFELFLEPKKTNLARRVDLQ